MKAFGDWIARGGLAMAGRRSPWGGGDGDDQDTAGRAGEPDSVETDPDAPGKESPAKGERPNKPGRPDGPRNPWLPAGDGTPPRRSASIDEIFRPRGATRRGGGGPGGGGGFHLPPRNDGKSWTPIIAGALVLLWLGITTTHQVGPKEQGIVTTFGSYSRTITPGISFSLPWPIENVDIVDVTSIKVDSIPEGAEEKLMLTSDQNLVDLSYLVRWNIKDLELYKFQLANPAQAVREVAEAAMRASVAEVDLGSAMGGSGRAQIEENVSTRMQAVLDAYRSGVQIQGVEIKKADPPEKVIAAFQAVTAAQQDAQRELSNAQAWSQQLMARAQGDAAAFNQVYEQYRLAPDVTRRRMYYETMERVLGNNEKVIMGEGANATSYLPLPEVRRRAQQSATPSVATPSPAPGAP